MGGRNADLIAEKSKYDFGKSLLSQLRESFASSAVYHLGEDFKSISSFSEIRVDRNAPARLPQQADLPNSFLASDGSNLGLILDRIRRDGEARQGLKAAIQDLYKNIEDVDVQIVGGTIQVFVYEGRMAVPATRLSSGTLRFLCLLAILLHPEPPPRCRAHSEFATQSGCAMIAARREVPP